MVEKQKLALNSLLKPKIILLDEPTKGLDGIFKIHQLKLLKFARERDYNCSVTHDIEFSAMVCDECALLFDNIIINKATRNSS